MKNILKQILAVSILVAGCCIPAVAGIITMARDTTEPMLELTKVYEANRTKDAAIMNFRYDVEEVNGAVTNRDTLSLQCRFEEDKYEFTVGKIMQVQEGLYKLTFYQEDSMVYVENAAGLPVFQPLFQINVFDVTLHTKYMDTITVTDSANTRKITFLFKPQAPYISYNIVYEKSSYLVKRIMYIMRKEIAPANTVGYTPSKFRRITITRNANTTQPGALPIAASQYITRQNGVLGLKAPYTNYRIIDATKQ